MDSNQEMADALYWIAVQEGYTLTGKLEAVDSKA